MAVRQVDLEIGGGVVYRFPPIRQERIRMLRRRRVLRRRVALGVVGVGLVLATLFGGGPEGMTAAAPQRPPASVVLRPGETVWDLAERRAPSTVDPRAYVDAIIELNGLAGTTPVAGERVLLPG